jgi:kynurenine formamidase
MTFGVIEMCHACVIENVKSNMLSRRDLFRGGLAAAGAVAAVSALPTPLFAQAAAPTKAHDLTHELYETFPTYFGGQQLFMEQKFSHAKDTFNLFEMRLSEHTGTHIDAPLHFTSDGKSVAELAIEDLFGPLVVIDIKAKAAENADAQVTPDDIKAWVAANGELPAGAIVAMNSGWGAHLATDKFRNADDKKMMHFPGFHLEAVQALMEAPSIKAIAVDTLSLDFGMSPDFIVHNTWLPSGRYGIEGIANLDSVPASGATIVVGAPKVKGGTGGPARIFAMV